MSFCGEVNAKNSMGGYGGWTGFLLEPHLDEPKHSMLMLGNDLAAAIVQQACTSAVDVDHADHSGDLTFTR